MSYTIYNSHDVVFYQREDFKFRNIKNRFGEEMKGLLSASQIEDFFNDTTINVAIVDQNGDTISENLGNRHDSFAESIGR